MWASALGSACSFVLLVPALLCALLALLALVVTLLAQFSKMTHVMPRCNIVRIAQLFVVAACFNAPVRAASSSPDATVESMIPIDDICRRYGHQKSWGGELEPLLHQCIQTLAASALMRASRLRAGGGGIVIDAGANSGEGSVQLACDFPRHIVLAIEPTRVNYESVTKLTASLPNVRTIWGGLSSVGNRSMAYGKHIDAQQPGVTSQTGLDEEIAAAHYHESIHIPLVEFPVHTVDELVAQTGAPLVFAHWDVEGFEHDVLLGARQTIARDRPPFTVEAFPVHKAAAYQQLRRDVASLGYTLHEVPEACGVPSDCRNFLALPRNTTNPCAALFAERATAPVLSASSE